MIVHLVGVPRQHPLVEALHGGQGRTVAQQHLEKFQPSHVPSQHDKAESQRLAPYATGSTAFDSEYLQLAYQIAIHGRDELALAPDERAGFTMTLLRLYAFRPETPAALTAKASEPPQARRAEPPRAAAAAPLVAAGTGRVFLRNSHEFFSEKFTSPSDSIIF